MSTLYQIEQSILECFDVESGEILDADKLDALMVERDEKIENVALWIKNLLSDADALNAEKTAFAEREKTARNKADSLKRWLANALGGEKFSTSKVQIGFRKSETLVIDNEDNFIEWASTHNRGDLLKFGKPTVDKIAVKQFLKSGETLDGVSIVSNQNIQIK